MCFDVLTTPSRNLTHIHWSFILVQDRHVPRGTWNSKSSELQDHLFFRVFLKNKRGKPRILCPPQNSQDPKDKHVEHPKNVFSFQFLKIYFYQVSCFLVQFVRSIKKNRFVNQVCHVWEMCHTRSVWETCCTRTRTRSFFLLTNIENRSVWKLTGQPPVTDPVNFLPPLSVLPSLSVVVRLLLTLKKQGRGSCQFTVHVRVVKIFVDPIHLDIFAHRVFGMDVYVWPSYYTHGCHVVTLLPRGVVGHVVWCHVVLYQ